VTGTQEAIFILRRSGSRDGGGAMMGCTIVVALGGQLARLL
jgi:hypothetical protein